MTFTRGPATQRDAGERWDVRFYNIRGGDAAPRWDYPTPDDALRAVARLAYRLGYAIPVQWVDAQGNPIPPSDTTSRP
jgi:hypothetical protein